MIPFGPVNAPSFYTCMMENLKTEWDALFHQCISELATSKTLLGGHTVTIEGKGILLEGLKINSGTKYIIDGILIWNLPS